MTDATNVNHVLDHLETEGVPAWVMGGWGVDALVGEQTREHGDLDVLIRERDERTAIEVLASLGFEVTEDARPAHVRLADGHGNVVDIFPARFDADGNAHLRDADGTVRHQVPDAAFGIGRIDGREVYCITLEGQAVLHAGFEETEPGRLNLATLRERLGLGG